MSRVQAAIGPHDNLLSIARNGSWNAPAIWQDWQEATRRAGQQEIGEEEDHKETTPKTGLDGEKASQ